MIEPFVDANSVAQFLSIKRRQVLEMTRKGVIPAHPLVTGTSRRIWRYKLSEVDAAASGTRTPTTPDEDGALAERFLQCKMRSGSPRNQRRKSNG